MIEIEKEMLGDVCVLAVKGRLDNATAADFDRTIEPMAGGRTVLDLAELVYISSAGLRGLLGALKRAKSSGGTLAVAAPSASVLEVLEISGFKGLLPVHADRSAAVAAG